MYETLYHPSTSPAPTPGLAFSPAPSACLCLIPNWLKAWPEIRHAFLPFPIGHANYGAKGNQTTDGTIAMWEYKIAQLDISYSPTVSAVEKALNALGKDDWEIIAVISMSDVHSMPTAVICKREKK